MTVEDRFAYAEAFVDLYHEAIRLGYVGREQWTYIAPYLREWVEDFYRTRPY